MFAGVLATGGVLTKLNGGTAGGASNYQFAVSGLMLIVVAIMYPDGVTGAVARVIRRIRTRVASS